MRNLKLPGVLALVFSVSLTVIVASASAVEFLLAEWLAVGEPIVVAKAADAEGELLLEDNKALGVKVDVICSLVLKGTVGADGEGEFSTLTNLAGEEISKEVLLGRALACLNVENCASPKVWAEEGPWKTLAELMVDGTTNFFDNLVVGEAWHLECTILGTKATDLCKTAETAVELDDEAMGLVDAIYNDTFQSLAGLKLGTCTLGGVESGVVEGLLSMLLTNGEALSISSE